MTTYYPKYFCHLCQLSFADRTILQTHQSQTHPNYCALCECDFRSYEILQYHLGSAPSHNQVGSVRHSSTGEQSRRRAPYFENISRGRLGYRGDGAYDTEAYEPSSDGSVDIEDAENAESDEDSDAGDDPRSIERQNVDGANEAVAALEEIRTQDLKAVVQLWRETVILRQQQSMTYTCNICLDEPRLDSGRAIRLSPCNHIMCRECLRNGVQSDLNERKYPLRCPDCVAEQRTTEDNQLNDGVVKLLYLSDRSLQIYNELQLEQLAVRLHCNRCERISYVMEREFRTTPFFNCTFCRHRWCGVCNQEVEQGETGQFVPHSCDGSEEFGYLRNRRGWRVCPNPSCRATVEKVNGCNQLDCRCGRAFCYGCGVQRETHNRPFPCHDRRLSRSPSPLLP